MSGAVHAEDRPEFTEADLARFSLLRGLMLQCQQELRTSRVLSRIYAQQDVDAADDDLLDRVERETERLTAYMSDARDALRTGDAVAVADSIAKLQRGMGHE